MVCILEMTYILFYFFTGGSLCAVSVHGNLICSGYSSGAVVIWEGDGESAKSYRQLITTTDSQGQKPQAASTAINSTLCVAGFDNGKLIFGLNLFHRQLGDRLWLGDKLPSFNVLSILRQPSGQQLNNALNFFVFS